MSNPIDYQAVLRDLELKRAQLHRDIVDLDQAISAMRRLVPGQATFPLPSAASQPDNEIGKYANISMRWAILKLLCEDAIAPMTTGEIAQALLAGGRPASGVNFNSNVSAVLSVLKQRGEVQAALNGYEISDIGRQAWNVIKLTPQYRNRGASANVQ